MRLLTLSVLLLFNTGFAHLPEIAGTVKRLGAMLLSELGPLPHRNK